GAGDRVEDREGTHGRVTTAQEASPAPKPMGIDPLSVVSLFVQTLSKGRTLGTATGFVVKHGSRQFLITNWHVFSGKDPDTDRPMDPLAQLPDTVRVLHHLSSRLGSWATRDEPLSDQSGKQRWLEHSSGRNVDV